MVCVCSGLFVELLPIKNYFIPESTRYYNLRPYRDYDNDVPIGSFYVYKRYTLASCRTGTRTMTLGLSRHSVGITLFLSLHGNDNGYGPRQ